VLTCLAFTKSSLRPYLITPTKAIAKYATGCNRWIGKTIKAATPTNLYVSRERAATTSTQDDESSALEEQDNNEDEMDKNPVQTEQLVEELYTQSTI
jgi:hypothetical protein